MKAKDRRQPSQDLPTATEPGVGMSGEEGGGRSDFTIAVIGLGHVGLPTAVGLVESGWTVIGTDTSEATVKAVAGGRSPFYEPGLDPLLRKHVASGRLRVTLDLEEAAREADVLFVCVGTPQAADGVADLSQIESVARAIARHARGDKLVVEKSTAPVRTAARLSQTLQRFSNGMHRFDVAVSPEFLQEGTAVHDVLHPDRVILGVESEAAQARLEQIYRPLQDRLPLDGTCPECVRQGRGPRGGQWLVVTDTNTAEIIKHAANAFLATKISFVNMVADLCEATGADVTDVAHALGLDPRIGPHFLRAGIGFGGYCLPKDLRAFIHIAEEHRVDFDLLKAVLHINERRIDRFCAKVRQAVWVVQGKTFGVLGLAFKPATDDVREAPSLKIIRRLLADGARVQLHDPAAVEPARLELPDDPERVVFSESPYEAARGAHALLLLTEWEEYRALDLARVRDLMEIPILVDGRNLYDPRTMRSLGFEYLALGRP